MRLVEIWIKTLPLYRKIQRFAAELDMTERRDFGLSGEWRRVGTGLTLSAPVFSLVFDEQQPCLSRAKPLMIRRNLSGRDQNANFVLFNVAYDDRESTISKPSLSELTSSKLQRYLGWYNARNCTCKYNTGSQYLGEIKSSINISGIYYNAVERDLTHVD